MSSAPRIEHVFTAMQTISFIEKSLTSESGIYLNQEFHLFQANLTKTAFNIAMG